MQKSVSVKVDFAKFDSRTSGFRSWVPVKIRSKSCYVAIYALVDPRDGTCRYIGKTTNPARRQMQHEKSRRRCNPHLRSWLVELRAYGHAPRLVVVDWVSPARWPEAEKRWIAYFASLGRVYNISPGGDGSRTWEPETEEGRQRYESATRAAKRWEAKAADRFLSSKEPLPMNRWSGVCDK